MSKINQVERVQGHPIRCYDNGGRTFDRYTVVFLDQPERVVNLFAALAMSDAPFHPQGFGQHSSARVGRHLGKRVEFASLPDDCRRLVRQEWSSDEPN